MLAPLVYDAHATETGAATAHVQSPDHPVISDAFRYGYELNLVNEKAAGRTFQTLTVGSIFHNQLVPDLSPNRASYSVWTRDLYWGFLGWAQAGDDSVLSVMRDSIDLMIIAKNMNRAIGANKTWPLNDNRLYIPQAWLKGPQIADTFMPYNTESQAQFILLVAQYYRLTGDRECLRRWWPDVRYVAETLDALDTDGNHLPDRVWGSYDYQGVPVGAEESWLCSSVYGGWQAAAELADVLKEKKLANHYREQANALRKAMNRTVDEGGLWKPDKDGGYYVNMRHTTPLPRSVDDRFIPYENLGPIYFHVASPAQAQAIWKRLDAGFEQFYNLKYGPMYVGPAAADPKSEFPFTSAPWLGFLDVYLRVRDGIPGNRDRIFKLLVEHAHDIPPACFTEGLGITGYLSGVSGRSWDNANFFHALLVGVYGIEKTSGGIILRKPTSIAGTPLTKLENVRWRKADYILNWENSGDRIRRVTLDGKELKTNHDGEYLLEPAEGKHEVRVELESQNTQTAAGVINISNDKILRCFTSKLHFLPEEKIAWRALVYRDKYPDLQSSKIMTVELLDAAGNVMDSDVQQYGLPPEKSVQQLDGAFAPHKAWASGKYRIKVTSEDQRTGIRFQSVHDFGVLAPTDPYVCELPFRFLKDFTIVRDDAGMFHVYGITGELIGGHGWEYDGQERTFCHVTSSDLRHWKSESPVLSIHDKFYPDGNGRYQNRNIWAPHIIRTKQKYYMYYTSVNNAVSQSISLAISDDLYHWKEYEQNPVLTLEHSSWADWARDRWADCRDPMVLEHQGKYYMYVTARAKAGEPKGVAAVSMSDDLLHWSEPVIAMRGQQPESVQVWPGGSTFFLTASTGIRGSSVDPFKGWQAENFVTLPLPGCEPYVHTSSGYADEICALPAGRRLYATLTWRLWGNSVYLFELIDNPDGSPAKYISPFTIK
jgi:hypothetical protein